MALGRRRPSGTGSGAEVSAIILPPISASFEYFLLLLLLLPLPPGARHAVPSSAPLRALDGPGPPQPSGPAAASAAIHLSRLVFRPSGPAMATMAWLFALGARGVARSFCLVLLLALALLLFSLPCTASCSWFACSVDAMRLACARGLPAA